ncbi:uncharacterized protein LOC143066866 [Mytilus galloprovincialis]|uniref:uncharacterized protein LOC143066866 n=1 Tax=Mytilus galloprovincialis TaxID=29158 RepID=UPI003F7C2C60
MELLYKYIKFDPVIICLDALLLKREAFQHVLSNNFTQVQLYEIVSGILLSNFGKILVIPAVLWGYSEMYVWLSAIFVCASNVQAFRVLCPSWPAIFCAVVVISSHVVASKTGRTLYNVHSAIK